FVEYEIGDETIAIVRKHDGDVHAFHNACLHRGRRLAEGCGSFDGMIRCPYHGWCYALDGRLVDVPDREEFPSLPDDLALRPVRVETWGGFVFGDLDEGEILAALVAGLGGAFLAEERAAVEELRAAGPAPGSTLLEAYQRRRMEVLGARGFDVSGFSPDLMTSADDVFCFPNVVGPIYPGSAI